MNKKNLDLTIEEDSIEETESKMSNKKYFMILASPIIAPVALCAVMMPVMFIFCGWLIVGTVFLCAVGAIAIGVCGIIGAIVNSANLGSLFIMLSCSFISIGLIYPILSIAIEFFQSYKGLQKSLWNKTEEMIKKGWILYGKGN